MCGFLPLPQIIQNLQDTPELTALIPPTILSTFINSTTSIPAQKTALRDLFAAIMTAEESQFKAQLDLLIARYELIDQHTPLQTLVLRLHSQFPGDIGIFCAFLLNHVLLQPGEAIFLGAGEPHAYVSGGTSLVIPHTYLAQWKDGRYHRMHGQLR
jgi:mannose-6-phosphate isomerase